MKKFKTLTRITTLAVIMLVSTVALNALNPPATMSLVQTEMVQKTLRKAVDFPKYTGEAGIVKVQLNIDENGRTIVERINGQPELRAHVIKKLENVIFDDVNLTGKTFIVKFDYRN